jgi:quinol monooxygenase YgiN
MLTGGCFAERKILMIILTVRMHAFPEKQKEVMQTLLSMIEPTGKEKGCLSHDVFCDIEDKNAFSMLEAWENREYLEHHLRSNRFGVLLGTRSLLAKPLKMKIHTVSHSEGVEVANALRGKGTSKKEGL